MLIAGAGADLPARLAVRVAGDHPGVPADLLPDRDYAALEASIMVWFGALVAVILQTAFLSPPVAMSAYYLKQVVKDWSLATIYDGMFQFMILQVICIGCILHFPQIALWFPQTLQASRGSSRSPTSTRRSSSSKGRRATRWRMTTGARNSPGTNGEWPLANGEPHSPLATHHSPLPADPAPTHRQGASSSLETRAIGSRNTAERASTCLGQCLGMRPSAASSANIEASMTPTIIQEIEREQIAPSLPSAWCPSSPPEIPCASW